MGDLITMTRSNASPAIRPHTGGDAEILFFTGVRYHRFEDDMPSHYTRSRRRSRETRAAQDEAMRPDQQA